MAEFKQEDRLKVSQALDTAFVHLVECLVDSWPKDVHIVRFHDGPQDLLDDEMESVGCDFARSCSRRGGKESINGGGGERIEEREVAQRSVAADGLHSFRLRGKG